MFLAKMCVKPDVFSGHILTICIYRLNSNVGASCDYIAFKMYVKECVKQEVLLLIRKRDANKCLNV